MEKKKNKYGTELFARINEDKRSHILNIAIREFAYNGYENANVNRIARDAGISVGSLYKYFVTKDDLYMYIVDDSAQKINAYVQEILNSNSTVYDRVEMLMKTAYEYSVSNPDLIKLYDVLTSDSSRVRAESISDKLESITAAAYRELMEDAQRKGEVRNDVDPGVLALMIDNQLMATQFSFATAYYGRRINLYLQSEDVDVDRMICDIMMVIKSMLDPV